MDNVVECKSSNQRLTLTINPSFEKRNTAVAKLLVAAYEISKQSDFHFAVATTDNPVFLKNCKTYNFSTTNHDYASTVPDFLFDCWTECDIDDYDSFCSKLSEWGLCKPSTDKVGWVGANTSEVRTKMLIYCIHDIFYKNHCEFIVGEKKFNNFMSFEDQIKKWRFLVDAEGIGWSARLKLLFFSRRVVFLVDRPCKEFYFEKIVPWKHYVPVSRDLSDFKKNISLLLNDSLLEESIKQNAFDFAKKNLTRQCAIQYLANIMNSSIGCCQNPS